MTLATVTKQAHTKMTIYVPVKFKLKIQMQAKLTNKSASQVVVEKFENEQKPNKFLKYFSMGDLNSNNEFSEELKTNRKDFTTFEDKNLF